MLLYTPARVNIRCHLPPKGQPNKENLRFNTDAIVESSEKLHLWYLSYTGVKMAAPEKKWPELVGKTGEEAKAIIESQDSSLEVIILNENSMVTRDLRFDRVRIYVKEDGTVASTPMTG